MKEGWEYKTLGEIAKVFAGGDVPKNRMSKCKKEPFIIPIYTNGIENEGLYGYTDIARVNDLSLTISARGTIGAIFKRNNPFFPAIRLITVCPQNIVDINFLYYVLLNSTFTKSGTTIPQLTVPMLKQYRFAIPENISIQQNIANYLDSSFKLIDEIKNKALKSLTEAKALFQSALAEAMESKDGWEYKTLGEVVSFSRGLTYKKSDEVDYSTKVVLRSTNINVDNNSLNIDELKYLNENIEFEEEKLIKKGSILICMSNGSKKHLGKVALIEHDYKYAFGGFMGLLTPVIKINSKYLYYTLTTPKYKEYIKSLSEGANINNLKIKDIQKYIIPIFPLNEQNQIVSRLDKLSSKVRAIEEKYQKMVEECDALKQAMLRDVFE